MLYVDLFCVLTFTVSQMSGVLMQSPKTILFVGMDDVLLKFGLMASLGIPGVAVFIQRPASCGLQITARTSGKCFTV